MNAEVNESVKYIKNPEVVLREEDPDGGLLFNPDTNQIKVINATGLFIWEKCDGQYDISEFIRELQQSFEGVPEEQAANQVKKFLNEMVNSGFIGVLEEQKK